MELQELKTNICKILGLNETSLTEHQLEQMASNFRTFELIKQQEKDKLMVMASMIASGLYANGNYHNVVKSSIISAKSIIKQVNEDDDSNL